ncbi:MAG: dihydrolipoamide acetyltransferase family protein [Steroidobacteraceae bacterium]
MDILMPQLGETVTEGTLAIWAKAVGDAVQPGDILFEIETDKSSMEIPVTVAGIVKEIRVPKGAVVPVGTVVAVIQVEGGAAAEPSAPAVSAAPVAAAAPVPVHVAAPVSASVAATQRTSSVSTVPTAERDHHNVVLTPDKNYGPAKLPDGTLVTPLARRLANQGQINLGQLTGSGPRGRILARDVEAAISSGGARSAPMAATANAQSIIAQYANTPHDVIPVDNMRKIIARRLLESKQTVPHFYLSVNVLLDALNALRADANQAAVANGSDLKLSVTDFIIKALGNALIRVPEANSVWAEDRILRFSQADVGVAVAIDGGLMTPVVRSVEGKSLGGVSREMKSLIARARTRKLQPAEYSGGAISISNLGMYGVNDFAAIINPPQSAILAVGAAMRVPVEAADGSVKFASQMAVTLSCDHRVIDGAVGAQLLAAFKSAIENPVSLML